MIGEIILSEKYNFTKELNAIIEGAYERAEILSEQKQNRTSADIETEQLSEKIYNQLNKGSNVDPDMVAEYNHYDISFSEIMKDIQKFTMSIDKNISSEQALKELNEYVNNNYVMHRFEKTNENYMSARLSPMYLTELATYIEMVFGEGTDYSPFVHIMHIILSNFNIFAAFLTNLYVNYIQVMNNSEMDNIFPEEELFGEKQLGAEYEQMAEAIAGVANYYSTLMMHMETWLTQTLKPENDKDDVGVGEFFMTQYVTLVVIIMFRIEFTFMDFVDY